MGHNNKNVYASLNNNFCPPHALTHHWYTASFIWLSLLGFSLCLFLPLGLSFNTPAFIMSWIKGGEDWITDYSLEYKVVVIELLQMVRRQVVLLEALQLSLRWSYSYWDYNELFYNLQCLTETSTSTFSTFQDMLYWSAKSCIVRPDLSKDNTSSLWARPSTGSRLILR